MTGSPAFEDLPDQPYLTLKRSVRSAIELFREENIPLQTKEDQLKQEYGAITGDMTIEHEGEELTLQKAATLLRSTDRQLREDIYRKIAQRRLKDKERLDELFDQLIEVRHQIAQNAGFDNYRDYMFKAMGRFDYTVDDCLEFHKAVEEEVVPAMDSLMQKRQKQMGIGELRPWDTAVDPLGREPLKPFSDGNDLLQKTKACFQRMDPFLSECLNALEHLKHLDLESRKGKAPGGYNYPLDEIGVPFIFMNAAGTVRDMVTLIHEGGHAVHSILSKDLPLSFFMHTPSEAAELASMSMELMSLNEWGVFFDNEGDTNRAVTEHMEDVLATLPWVAAIDAYQHWIYTHPGHSATDRQNAWLDIHQRFGSSTLNWEGLEEQRRNMWQKQLHLFEVPFYYIEYGIAQIGAIGIWKNWKEKGKAALEDYLNALDLGYTRPLPELYETAGVPFDFSKEHIAQMKAFVQEQIEAQEKHSPIEP